MYSVAGMFVVLQSSHRIRSYFTHRNRSNGTETSMTSLKTSHCTVVFAFRLLRSGFGQFERIGHRAKLELVLPQT